MKVIRGFFNGYGRALIVATFFVVGWIALDWLFSDLRLASQYTSMFFCTQGGAWVAFNYSDNPIFSRA